MKTIFRNTLLAFLAITTASPLISMDWVRRVAQPYIGPAPLPAAMPAPAVTSPKVARISNNMEGQNAVITFETPELHVEEVKPQTDLMLGSSLNAQSAQNLEQILMATNAGFTLRGAYPKMFISTPAGVAMLTNLGSSAMAIFMPYSGSQSIRSTVDAQRVRVVIGADGFVTLLDDAEAR